MKLSEFIESNITDCFAALPLASCRVTKERLIADAPSLCHAVILVVPYPHGEKSNMASFARIPDYHTFFTSFRDEVEALLAPRYHGLEVRIFADHSPIDERHAACLTGLGVIGDNGLFISNKYGSFIFLGEIILSLDEDELAEEGIAVAEESPLLFCPHCGACARACPGGCIGGDKSTCVSALTQKKGVLSDSEIDIMKRGGSVWGCDVCAEVCPLNKGKNAEYKEFFKHYAAPLSREDIEAMDDAEYAKYPFSWRKKEIILRNFKIIEGTLDK